MGFFRNIVRALAGSSGQNDDDRMMGSVIISKEPLDGWEIDREGEIVISCDDGEDDSERSERKG